MDNQIDSAKLARIHEWLGVVCLDCVVGSKGHMRSTLPPPSDALETQVRRKLNSEGISVDYSSSGMIYLNHVSTVAYGRDIYEATYLYLSRLA